MNEMKRIDITPELQAALDAIAVAEQRFVPGRDSCNVIDLPKLALADAVLASMRAAHADHLRRLPVRARPVPVLVEVTLRPTRQRR